MTFEQRVKNELTPVDFEKQFDELLDELYSFEGVGGPFASMLPSRVLREVDPVAHRCGVNDMDTEGLEEIDGEWYDASDVAELRETEDAC